MDVSQINRRKLKRNRFEKKLVPNTQEAPMDELALKPVPEPEMKKIQSLEVKHAPKQQKPNDANDYRKELLYKRDQEVKEKFSKGKILVVLEPSQKQEYFLVRLKECLSKKRGLAFVDFYDRCTPEDEYSQQFTLKDEGIVQWENTIGVLNIKVKNTETIHEIKLAQSFVDKLNKMAGVLKAPKRVKKLKQKEDEEKGEEDDYAPGSDSSDDESFDLLPSDDDNYMKAKPAAQAKAKKVRRPKKTPGQKAAEEQKKRQDAEAKDRKLDPDFVDNGIRIVKTRLADDGVTEEIVEIDPTVKEIRPKKWKLVTRAEEDKDAIIMDQEYMRLDMNPELLFLDNSMTTANRNIIRAALTDNAELAKQCISEIHSLSSLMESWSPELKSTAIELAISNNSRKVLELLLECCREIEAQTR